MGLYDRDYGIQPTPIKHPVTGRVSLAASSLLRGLMDATGKPFGYDNPPMQMLANVLELPAIANTLEDYAYGSPLTRGSGQATSLRPDARSTLMALAPAAPGAAKAAVAGARKAASELGPVAANMAEQYMIDNGMILAAAPKGKAAAASKQVGGAIRSGTLADAKREGGALTVDQLRDSPAAVAARRQMIREHMNQPVEPWVPPDATSLFDRRLIQDAMQGHPGVEQVPLARLEPTARANLAPAQNLFTPENIELIKLQAERGAKLGGETYYPSTYPIRAKYGETNGPLTFDDFVWANAATSPQAPLPLNIPNATLMLRMKREGIDPTWENAQALAKQLKEKHNVGFFLGPSHVNNWNEHLGGGLLGYDKQQKIASYGQGLRGNFQPYTIDTQETKGLSQGTAYFPYFDKQKGVSEREYGTIENSARKIAQELGIPPAQMQAGRWFGGGELTGLRSPRGDFLNTFEDLIKYNGQMRGWDTSRSAMDQKINQVLQGEEILLPYWRKTPMIEYDRGLFD